MEVSPERLLEIFKAAYRLGEATTTYKPNPLVVASDNEIEADAFPIILNILKIKLVHLPRHVAVSERAKVIWNSLVSKVKDGVEPTMIGFDEVHGDNKDLYKGVFY